MCQQQQGLCVWVCVCVCVWLLSRHKAAALSLFHLLAGNRQRGARVFLFFLFQASGACIHRGLLVSTTCMLHGRQYPRQNMALPSVCMWPDNQHNHMLGTHVMRQEAECVIVVCNMHVTAGASSSFFLPRNLAGRGRSLDGRACMEPCARCVGAGSWLTLGRCCSQGRGAKTGGNA